MKHQHKLIHDTVLTVLILGLALGINLLLNSLLEFRTQTTSLFILGAFLISLLTEGYACGIIASLLSVILVNFVFTTPFYAFDFFSAEKVFSALTMLSISVMTGTLTTKLKNQEKIRVESEREKMRADLLRALSHDLRTPLTSIYGASSALLENYESIPSGRQKKLLEDIQSDSQWLINMVENLLSVIRIDGDKVSLTTAPVVVEELIEETFSRFYTRYPHQEVKLSIPDDFICVKADAMLIKQVLLNLLENAVLHAAGMTELKLSIERNSGKVWFTVSDNGCGIPKDRLDKLFTGVIPSDIPADGSHRNMGIGLYVCATIISAHGGHLTARNLPEGGAAFTFQLTEEDSEHE